MLFVSAALGTIGLYLLGNPAINSVWPWMAAVTIYGIGKTFYWPTLLGVISERFPKGGALALGISGGVGMIGAGMLGSPGIGYEQDYFAVSYLEHNDGAATYRRYMAVNDQGKPDEKGFPILTSLFPKEIPLVAGIDNAKLKVFDDYNAYLEKTDKALTDGTPGPTGPATTLDADLATIDKLKAEGKPVEPKLEQNLQKLKEWWTNEGLPNFEEDRRVLIPAELYGAKTALLYTALVPLGLCVGFMILIVYFYLTGGYKQVHLQEQHPPMEEY